MSSTAEPVAAKVTGAAQLRGGSLSFLETIGQSVANVGPTLTPALNITVVAGMAGVGSWLAYLIATIGMMFVAANIGVLAKRHPMAGSYFVYIGRTLGPLAGMIAGWSMIAAYLFTAVAVVFGGEIFLTNFLTAIGTPDLAPPAWLFDVVFIGLVAFSSYRDIRLSSRLGVVLETVSLTIIAIITVVALSRKATIVDPAQLTFSTLPYAGIMGSLAFAVFSFVGFESAASLAKEVRNPTRIIPLAITMCAGLAGLFFVVMAYAMMVGVDDKADVLGNSSSPFAEITSRAGLTWAAAVVYFSAMISVFACGLASINAVSRLMFSMGRYQYIHRSMGVVHATHKTPYLAVGAASVLTLIACLLLKGPAPVDAFGYTGTFATFGFLVIYLLICIVAPMDLKRAGVLKAHNVILGVIGVGLMAFVIFGSIYPVPPAPYNLIPYIFAGYLVLGVLWYAVMKSRMPHGVAGIQMDLEM